MQNHLSQRISCPHCGHHIHITLDARDYFEDCSACCNPIHFNMHIDYANSKVELHIDSDDEQIF